MPHRTGPTNSELKALIDELKQAGYKGNKFLARLGKELDKATRNRREVSLARINRTAKEGEMVVVPGKVLDGRLEKKLTIAAWRFSAQARESVKNSGGKIMSISELMKSGKAARIIG
jgi:large subunit ribosomal protein L18e